MRKLMHSKKGFTLVELMIVVVIMAILVAVAVPIYSAVTKNAEKRSCQANMRVIKDNLNDYQMMGGENGALIPWTTLASVFPGSELTADDAPSAFVAMFNDGIPTCPSDKTNYTVTVAEAGQITVTCSNDDHNAT